MKISLDLDDLGNYLLVAEDGRTILVQSDWDYPGVAQSFGWIPCHCRKTDGTVDCEHRTASEMINEAREYLDEHLHSVIDDPGYFDNEE